jgi:sporulation protein YlmC with PRC-barrel domain
MIVTASPAFAQASNTSVASASDSSQAGPSSGGFVTQQALDQWRASKLVGVRVYGPDQKKVGSIKDVLMDHEGNAQAIVIGVGGFLGIGAKDVAVPFKAVQWRTEGREVAVNSPGSTVNGSRLATVKTDPAATEASQGYPDKAMISMTEEQLKTAPDFQYAQNPVADSSTGAPAGGRASTGGAMTNSAPSTKQ